MFIFLEEHCHLGYSLIKAKLDFGGAYQRKASEKASRNMLQAVLTL
jgi:hypothetical protein